MVLTGHGTLTGNASIFLSKSSMKEKIKRLFQRSDPFIGTVYRVTGKTGKRFSFLLGEYEEAVIALKAAKHTRTYNDDRKAARWVLSLRKRIMDGIHKLIPEVKEGGYTVDIERTADDTVEITIKDKTPWAKAAEKNRTSIS